MGTKDKDDLPAELVRSVALIAASLTTVGGAANSTKDVLVRANQFQDWIVTGETPPVGEVRTPFGSSR